MSMFGLRNKLKSVVKNVLGVEEEVAENKTASWSEPQEAPPEKEEIKEEIFSKKWVQKYENSSLSGIKVKNKNSMYIILNKVKTSKINRCFYMPLN